MHSHGGRFGETAEGARDTDGHAMANATVVAYWSSDFNRSFATSQGIVGPFRRCLIIDQNSGELTS
jgi:hypothetical protein